MDATNQEALRLWGANAKKILADLANIPEVPGYFGVPASPGEVASPEEPRWRAAVEGAQAFVERHGALRDYAPPDAAPFEVINTAHWIRVAWNAKTRDDLERVNQILDQMLAPAMSFDPRGQHPMDRPAVRADFATGRWAPIPRRPLDVLLIELMRSRKLLHRCERVECQRYFVKEFSRDRYCNVRCSETARRLGQSEWARNRRRRKAAQPQKRKK